MTVYDDAVRDFLNAKAFESPLLGVWIYGSRAFGTEQAGSDIDVLVVLKDRIRPRHLSTDVGGLPSVKASINVVGAESLGGHAQFENGGFFFTGKLLSPHYLLMGHDQECEELVASAIAAMLDPWGLYLLPDSYEAEVVSAEQCFALLTLLKIQIDYCYLRHFASWRGSQRFSEYWTSVVATVSRAMLLCSSRVTDRGMLQLDLSRREAEQNIRRVGVQYLVACFWQFNYYLRGENREFIQGYFAKQTAAFRNITEPRLAESLQFLWDKVRVRV